jgi:hypothetical protein
MAMLGPGNPWADAREIGMSRQLVIPGRQMLRDWRKNMAAMAKEVEDAKFKNVFKRGIKSVFKGIKKVGKVFQEFSKVAMQVGKFALDTVGVFLQVADKMGILGPLMNLFSGILNIMGGFALEAMGPALKDLADVLFSDEMIEVWGDLGTAIGDFLAIIMQHISTLLQNPEFIKVLKGFVTVIANVLGAIGGAIGAFFGMLSGMDASQMGRLFYGMAVLFAFMKGMSVGGVAGAVLGAIYAGLTAVALSPLLSLQHGGITTGPTLAQVGDNPSGKELILPLDSEEGMSILGGSQEVLWATEENGRKLDRLIGAMETSNRIKRLKYL